MHTGPRPVSASHVEMTEIVMPEDLNPYEFAQRQFDRAAETWVMPMSGGAPRSLGPKTSAGVISPDGKQLVAFELTTGADGLIRGTAKLFHADGTPTGVTVDVPQRDANTLAWSPDGASFTLIDQSDPARNPRERRRDFV